METTDAEGGLTRQPRRRRAKTTKALEIDNYESDTEDTVHVVAATPSIPRPKRTEKNLRPKDQIVLIRNRVMAEKRATIANYLKTEEINTATNMQIRVLTNLVISLLGVIEEQKEA